MKTSCNDDVKVYSDVKFAINKDDQNVIRMTCMNSGIDSILHICHIIKVTFALTKTKNVQGS